MTNTNILIETTGGGAIIREVNTDEPYSHRCLLEMLIYVCKLPERNYLTATLESKKDEEGNYIARMLTLQFSNARFENGDKFKSEVHPISGTHKVTVFHDLTTFDKPVEVLYLFKEYADVSNKLDEL